MNDLEIATFITVPSVLVLFGLILILISQITAPDPYTPSNPPRHLTTPSRSKPYVLEGVIDDLESYPQVGRRGRYSVARHMPVASDWCPYIGDRLITILQQSTTEFLFVRQAVSQLTDPYQRAQWATNLTIIS